MPRKFQTGLTRPYATDGRVVSVEQVPAGTMRPDLSDRVRVPVGAVVGVRTVGPADPGPVRVSRESREAFFDTLFDDFRFEARSSYNFYVPDESEDDVEHDYERLEDLPRYVTLTWDRAPDLPRPQNELRRPNGRAVRDAGNPVVAGGLRFDLSDSADFSVVRRMVSNGYLGMGAADVRLRTPTSPIETRGIDEELYLLSDDLRGVPVNHLASNDSRPAETVVYDSFGSRANASRPPTDPSRHLRGGPVGRVVDRVARAVITPDAVLGSLDQSNIMSGDSREHLEGVLAVSAYSTELGLIATLDDMVDERALDEPSLQSPEGTPRLEYIGYLVEKQVLDPSGAFRTVEEIEIPGRDAFSHIDTRVAYGRVYRYRVRCVLRWTHPSNVGLRGVLSEDPVDVRTAVRPITSQTSHFLNSSWSEYSPVAVLDLQPPSPPEQVSVSVRSDLGTVRVSWRFPADPQRDISGFSLHRRSMRGDIFTSEWEEIGRLPARNGSFVDRVEMSEDRSDRLVYAMTSTSLHGEVSALSEQISCRVNPSYMQEGEDELRQVSQPGASLFGHGALSVLPPRRELDPLRARRRVAVWPRTGASKFVNQDVDLVLRLESLDTGEIRDVLLDLNHVAVDPVEMPPPAPGRVPVDATMVGDDPDHETGGLGGRGPVGRASRLGSPG